MKRIKMEAAKPIQDSFDGLNDIQRLEKYFRLILDISQKTTGVKTDWAGVAAATAFAKLGMTCQTFLRILPGSSYFVLSDNTIYFDISSIAALCRNALDNYYVLSYLVHLPKEIEERDLRERVWRFHGISERMKMYRLAAHRLITSTKLNENVMKLHEDYSSLKSELKAQPLFQRLDEKIKKQIIEGRKFQLESNEELNRKVNIDHGVYRYVFKRCSTYVHSSPLSLSQLYDFIAAEGKFPDLVGMYLNFLCAYSVFSIREFRKVVEFEMPDISSDLKLWEGVFSNSLK